MSENVVHMKLEGSSKSHSRADIIARDVESVIDEPVARGGTNLVAHRNTNVLTYWLH